MILVDSPDGVRVTVDIDASKPCPHRDELDVGVLTVAWTTAGEGTIEVGSLAEYVEDMCGRPLSHEETVSNLCVAIDKLGMRDSGARWVGPAGGVMATAACGTSVTPAPR